MRRMSFMLTKPQMLDGSKEVTRRAGWSMLKPGDVVMAVEKCQGLKPGEKQVEIYPIEIISVRRERLDAMLVDSVYGSEECRREGFPDYSPGRFVAMFLASHKGTFSNSEINRIEFRKAAPKTCACQRGECRPGQRTCHQCHAEYMVNFRSRQRNERERLRRVEAMFNAQRAGVAAS